MELVFTPTSHIIESCVDLDFDQGWNPYAERLNAMAASKARSSSVIMYVFTMYAGCPKV